MAAAKPMRVALTGGIASGKSTVAALFAQLGVPVIDLDQLAREVVAPGTALLAQVLARFGPGVQAPDGSFDRGALRALVFRDAAARRELELMLHPAIRARAAELAAAVRAPYLIIVIPLLAESGAAAEYDRVLVVDCDEATAARAPGPPRRRQRGTRRRGTAGAGTARGTSRPGDRADR